MFGLGNDDEGKLEQNMREIKSMVETGEEDDPGDEQDHSLDQKDDLEKEIESFEQELEQEGNDSWQEAKDQARSEVESWSSEEADWQPPEKESEPEGSRFEEEYEDIQEESDTGEQHEVQEDQEVDTNSHGRVSKEESGVKGLNQQIPEPAQTKQLDVPDVEKGPLFIRQSKFERAAQLISDMQYLTDQVEATINAVEEQIQRSQETESEVRQLVDDFEKGRTEVEDIVSPGE